MNIIDFLKSDLIEGYSLNSNILELGDSIYEEEFDNLLKEKQKNFISFELNEKEDLDSNELSTLLTILTLNNYDRNKLCVEVNYKNKDDNNYIDNIYSKLNLLNVSLYIKPSKEVVLSDYTEILIKYKNILNNEKNKIYIFPIINFMEYLQLKIMVENFIEINESNKDKIQNILNPNKTEDIKYILLKSIDENTINNVKNHFFNSFTEEELNEIKNNTESILSGIKNEILKNSELYGFKIIQNY